MRLRQSRLVSSLLGNGLVYIITILAALGLKYHYSSASSDDLLWILRPTAGLVEFFTGTQFVYEQGTGYINKDALIIIANSCAGINFFIIAMCMTVFTFTHRIKSMRKKLFAFCANVAGIFLLTVSVNSLRIIVAMELFEADFSFLGLDRESIHRLEGVIFYFIFLYLLYFVIRKITGRKETKAI